MSCLLVTATLFEVAPLLDRLGVENARVMGAPGQVLELGDITCLVSGVGQLQCAVHLASLLARGSFSMVVQAGLAGSFSDELPKGSVVQVVEEVLGDLGAEDNGGFLDLFEMKLLGVDDPPFSDGVLKTTPYTGQALADYPCVRSVTVNRVLSESRSIEWVVQRYAPAVVNMEGAALFLACIKHEVPFVELRSISDRVGPRDKAKWDIPGAVRALDDALSRLLIELGVA
jgi:futalosine hydrolase